MDANALLFPVAKRFVAGTTSTEALTVVEDLRKQGLMATLDFLGEDVQSAREAESIVANYLDLIRLLRERDLNANLSIKLSALYLAGDAVAARDRLVTVLHAAHDLPDPFVRVDMERAATVGLTISIIETLQLEGYAVGPVLQAYLRRTAEDIEHMIARKIRVRLCKGAYSAPAELAYQDMPTIRREFLRLAESLLTRGTYPAIATHDAGLIAAIRQFVQQRHIPFESFEFQMLYGVRPALQRELARAGYNVRIYVPFGTHWSGYFRRRLLERKENAFFALGAIFSK